jgi:ClpP class serine protease
VKRIEGIQKDIHEHFIALVEERRAGKLKGNETTLFSGEFWTAPMAIELGLADSIGDLRSTLRQRYGEKVRMPLISESRGFFSRRIPGLSSLENLTRTPGLADDFISALEARALWGRYGL